MDVMNFPNGKNKDLTNNRMKRYTNSNRRIVSDYWIKYILFIQMTKYLIESAMILVEIFHGMRRRFSFYDHKHWISISNDWDNHCLAAFGIEYRIYFICNHMLLAQ